MPVVLSQVPVFQKRGEKHERNEREMERERSKFLGKTLRAVPWI